MSKENLAQIVSEMQRIKQASHGEVILVNKLSPPHQSHLPCCSSRGVIFHGVLGIYAGVTRLGECIEIEGKYIAVELTRKQNFELVLAEKEGLVIPFIEIPFERNCMVLEDRAYIGPDEISAVLKEKCNGHYDRFFADYVKAHRRV